MLALVGDRDFRQAVRSLHDRVMIRLRRSHRVARWLWRVQIPESVNVGLWDYTTLLLAKALWRHGRAGCRVWDLGCGAIAILAQVAARGSPGGIVASDLDQECVATSLAAVARLGQAIEVTESDLGEHIPGRFDIVLFNAPYLPQSQLGRLSNLDRSQQPERYARRFGGGADGLSGIRRFLADLQARSRLAPRGKILLGFNRYYLSVEVVERVAMEYGLHVVDRITALGNPSLVVVIQEAP